MNGYNDQEGGQVPVTADDPEVPIIDRLSSSPADVPWTAAGEALPYWSLYTQYSVHTGDCPVCLRAFAEGGSLCDEGDALEYATQWDIDAQHQAAAWN